MKIHCNSYTIIALLFCIMLIQACSSEPENEEMFFEEELKLNSYVEKIQQGKVDPEKLKKLYYLLGQATETKIHQLRGASDNSVFIHIDGHREAVYDKNGKLVQDGINDGSYNYHSPYEEPLMHFSMDISPWIVWGNSEKDPTEVKERIYAYMGDIEAGIMLYRKLGPIKETPTQWNAEGQVQALAVFLRAIEEGEAEELFKMLEADYEMSDKKIIRVLTKLNRGFEAVYAP